MKTFVPDKPCKNGHLLRYVNGHKCVACTCERSLRWQEANPEARRLIARRRAVRIYKENPERGRALVREHRIKSPDQYRARERTWRQSNPARVAAISNKRRAAKLQRTPAWLTAEAYERIAAIYMEAARLTKETGVIHHVDHEIPLQGKRVSGLHVPENLRPIPASENERKHNRWDH